MNAVSAPQAAPPSCNMTNGPAPGAFNQAIADAGTQVADRPPADAPPPMPSATDTRPAGDTRSAREIIDANPTLKNLGNQSGVKDKLKEQVGDFENDPDAAYRASEVLDHIKSSKTSGGEERSGDVKDNGKIEGFTKDGDARHGTEAGLLQDFGKHGYSALKSDQTLDKTSDKHVKEDGTNLDNAAVVGAEILDVMSKAVGLLGEVVEKTLGKVPGIGKLISAGAGVMTTAVSGGLNVGATAARGGDVKEAAKDMGYDVAQSAVESVVGLVDPTGIGAGAVGDKFRDSIDKTGASDGEGVVGSSGDFGGPSGKKGKGGASEDSGSTRGGVSGDQGGSTADRSPPKRTADEASLPGRPDGDAKAPRSDNPSNGTYNDKGKDASHLGITPGQNKQAGTHQSEHIVPYSAIHTNRGQGKENKDIENAMPAYYEDTLKHRAHAGTDAHAESFNGKKLDPDSQKYRQAEAKFNQDQAARLEEKGWPNGSQYRRDQHAALNDPAAVKEGTALSNAYQLNQLGYGQQAAHQASRPAPDPKTAASFDNMVKKNPPLNYTNDSGERIGALPNPARQAEVSLSHDMRNTGQYPTAQERMDAFDKFNEIPGSTPKPAGGNRHV